MAVDLSGPLTRKKAGTGHSYRFGEVWVPGVTTILRVLAKDALPMWAAGEAADVVANSARTVDGRLEVDMGELWDALREKDSTLLPKPTRLTLAGALKWRHRKVRDEAANRGTEVHRLAEQITSGREVLPPEELAGHVDAYLGWWDEWTPTDAMVEVSVGSRQWGGWGGTFDLACTIEGLGRCLIDLKTNRSGPFGETALQLAGYRYADVFLDPTNDGAETPMSELGIDWCGVVWLRADGYDFYPYRVGDDELRMFAYCRGLYGKWIQPFRSERYPDMAWGDSVRGSAIHRIQVA